jgi:hypothetical protein
MTDLQSMKDALSRAKYGYLGHFGEEVEQLRRRKGRWDDEMLKALRRFCRVFGLADGNGMGRPEF